MQIQINAPHMTLTDAFSDYMETTVPEILGTMTERITRVEIHLQDLNGQKGGVDTRCLIEARPRGLDPIAGEHTGVDAKEAFRDALLKVKRALEHRFDRLESKRK